MDSKFVMVALFVCLIGVTCLFWYEKTNYDRLFATYSALQKEYEFAELVWKENEEKFKTSLNLLNNEVEKYRINAEKYQMCVTEKIRELGDEHGKKEEELLRELEKDSSSDNTLKLIEEMLYGINKDNR